MRRGGKPDGPQRDIVDALRVAGCQVLIISGAGFGAPDLLCQSPSGRLRLIEVKARTGKLRPAQEEFRRLWPVAVVRTAEEALDAMFGREAA